ncbi:MAG: DUF2058 domain-containing protein [Cocleimonas sp.]
MAGSLQDQLLGKGLIKKQDANNIQTAKKKAVKQSRKNNTQLVNEAAELAKDAQKKQRQQSQTLNEQQKSKAKKKSLLAQIRQIIELNIIHNAPKKMSEDALLAYNFSDANKIKTLYISPQNQDLINRGKIAIAKLHNNSNDSYHLIPAEAAIKIKERDDQSIVLLNDKISDEGNDDDPYADFEVPDDLMW